MAQPVIQVEHLSKEYILGQIGTGTLRGDLQSLMARIRHQEDPNRKLWADAPQAKKASQERSRFCKNRSKGLGANFPNKRKVAPSHRACQV